MDKLPIAPDYLDRKMHFSPVWEQGITGFGVNVAVLDTGFTGIQGIGAAVSENLDFTGENRPIHHSSWHGTKVMSGIHAIASGAKLANFKVFPRSGEPSRMPVIRALQHCIDRLPMYRIVNISLSFDPIGFCSDDRYCDLCMKVSEASALGIVVVCAAGNRGPAYGTITCPARSRGCLKVVSTFGSIERDWWAKMPRFAKWWWMFSGKYGRTFGSSYSAAWASGSMALLISGCPDARQGELIRAAVESGHDIGEEIKMFNVDTALAKLRAMVEWRKRLELKGIYVWG